MPNALHGPPKPEVPPNAAAPGGCWRTVGQDLPAGMVVFLVALPLCLGVSLASGAPLFAGLIAGIVGGVAVSWASGSQLSVSGPAAGLTTVVLAGITQTGSYEAFLVAVVLAGTLQIGLGLLKAGVVGLYFPSAVIRGMLAAIGLILLLKQVPHFLGGDEDFFEDLNFFQPDGFNTFNSIGRALSELQPGALLIGLGSLAVLLLWERPALKRHRLTRLVPGALVVVVGGVLANLLLQAGRPEWQVAPTHLVSLPVLDSWADVVAAVRFPDWAVLARGQGVYVLAGTIAAVASLESLLSVEAVDKLDPHKRRTPPNRELLAQGAGNVLSGLLGGLPITAVIVRSSANIDAGGQTRLAAFAHGVLLLLAWLFLERVLNRIPLAALAAVLLLVGYKLTPPSLYRIQWKLGWAQFLPFIVTVAAILFTDLLKGVGMGLAVAAFFGLKAHATPAYFIHPEPTQRPGTVHLRLAKHVTFLNKAALATTFNNIAPGTHLILDGTGSVTIDYDVLEAIENFRQSAAERGLRLELRGIPRVQVMEH